MRLRTWRVKGSGGRGWIKFFLDTANLLEIETAKEMGLLDGVTTNPTLMAAEKEGFSELMTKICHLVEGPVSVEANTTQAADIVEEANRLVEYGRNVVVKVPITQEGLKAVRQLESSGIKTNVTLVFSPNQALLAAKAGASYVSPFVGRLDDIGHDSMVVVKEILQVFQVNQFRTQTIVASVRHPMHVLQSAKLGAPIVTMPFKVLELLFRHPLTDAGIDRFLKDWERVRNRSSVVKA